MGAIVKVLLDTHCLIKLTAGEKLAKKTLKLIDESEELLVSAITAWETAMLVKRGFISLDRSVLNWYKSALLAREIRQVDLTANILIQSTFLEWEHRDPADRIIVVSALEEESEIATEDALMLKFLKLK